MISSDKIEKYLLSEAVLQRWAHLSIAKRCIKIKREFNVDVKRETLRRFYLRSGVKNRPVKANMYPHGKDLDQLNDDRLALAEKLREFIFDDDTHVIYFDETSFHSWQHQRRAWSSLCKVKVPSTKLRGANFTLYGAISDCLRDSAYFEVHDSTNGVDFLAFMGNMRAQIRPELFDKRLVLVLDNHRGHKGEE